MQIFRAKYPYIHTQKVILRRNFLAVGSADIEGVIDFGITVNQIQSKTIDKPSSLVFSVNLDELTLNQADILRSILFNISVDQSHFNVREINETIAFDSTLDFNILNQLLIVAGINLSIDLSFDILSQLISRADASFDVTLSFDILNQLISRADASFDVTLAFDVLNQLTANTDISFDTDLNYITIKQLLANSSIDFNIDSNYNLLKQLVAGRSITFNTVLNQTTLVDGAGIVEAAISFIATMNQIQSNTLDINKAVSLITNLASSYNIQLNKIELISMLIDVAQSQDAIRGIPGAVDFDITLDDTHSNTLNKVAALILTTTMDQTVETQLNYGLFIAFATTLATQFSTDGETLVNMTFGLSVNQQQTNTRDLADAIAFSLETDTQTEIHLTAEGNVTLGVNMEQLATLQTVAQAGITFGHLLGLASIGSADLGIDISFGTVQNFSSDGFLIEFEIYTPDSRTLKVYIEDRTTIVDGGNRIFRINRP
jgi:hypothetical protein